MAKQGPKLIKGDRVGEWLIHEHLGSGGQAEVWRASHVTDRGPPRAIKVCLADDVVGRKRFEDEVTLTRSHPHHHVVRVHEASVTWMTKTKAGDASFYVMDLGEPLDALWLLRASPMRALQVVEEVGDALAFLHERANPIIHRDLKPSNILLAVEGRHAMLADFGIARLEDAIDGATKTQEIVGTEHFRAPELTAPGAKPTIASDVYSLGRVIEWLFTNQQPNQGEPHSIPSALGLDDAATAALDVVIGRACARRPEDRFASVRELAEALPDLIVGIRAAAEPVRGAAPAVTDDIDPQIEERLRRPFRGTHRKPGIARMELSMAPEPPTRVPDDGAGEALLVEALAMLNAAEIVNPNGVEMTAHGFTAGDEFVLRGALTLDGTLALGGAEGVVANLDVHALQARIATFIRTSSALSPRAHSFHLRFRAQGCGPLVAARPSKRGLDDVIVHSIAATADDTFVDRVAADVVVALAREAGEHRGFLRGLRGLVDGAAGLIDPSRHAHIHVEMSGPVRSARLVVANRGKGAARQIHVAVPVDEGSTPLASEPDKNPFPSLAVGDDYTLLAALSNSTPSVFDVVATWTNEDGTPGKSLRQISW